MTAREFADVYLQPYKAKGGELIPLLCPFCHGGENRDKNTFALNEVNGTYNCKRGSCGKQGNFAQLLRAFGIDGGNKYKRPEKTPRPATDAAKNYLALRGISEKTAAAYGVGVDGQGNLLFPYYDERGEHVFNKFRYPRKLRDGDRKAWREDGTKPVLFGMHLCDPDKPLTICEGEFDALACHEAGIPNAVSVPSGADDFTWLDTCWEFVGRFGKIYLFGDNDAPGREMIRRLSVKLSGSRVYVVEHLEKDANALLHAHGAEAVKAAWEAAKEIPVVGLLNLADVAPLDVANIDRVRTSIDKLNRQIGGFMMGDVTVWTGKRGEGKSTLMSQILLDAVEDGKRVCAYSGELRADRFQYWVDLQAAGPRHVQTYTDPTDGHAAYYVPPLIRDMIHAWYDGKFWLYDNTAALQDEQVTVLAVFEQAARRYDCRVFLIDNLMTVDYGNLPERDYYQQQTRFINQLATFANLYNVHVHLVAHPRKTREVNDSDEVSGSGNITNRAANVIAVNRSGKEAIGFDTSIDVLKNRWEGKTGAIGLCYDKASRRLYDAAAGPDREYGWERINFVEVEQTDVFGEL